MVCACGSDDLIAVAPGHAGEVFDELLIVSRPAPGIGLCAACWDIRHKSERDGSRATPGGIDVARPKKNQSETPQTEQSDMMDDDMDVVVAVAAKTITGDIRDFILNTLRFEQDKRPWDQRSEDDQRAAVATVEAHCTAIATKAVELIAAGGRKTIKATLSQVMIKDGIRATLEIGRQDERRHHLVDAQGAQVLIVVADSTEFEGERAPAAITPDQGDLVRDALVVHSDPDGKPEVPFH
jgi:hypothetical protein